MLKLALAGFLAIVISAAAVATVFAPPALTAAPRRLDAYCSESGDLCLGIFSRGGAVSFEIDTFTNYFSRYRLCVAPPRGTTTCRSFPMRYAGGPYASRVVWYRNFPNRGSGRYRVTWRLPSNALGPTLSFRLPL